MKIIVAEDTVLLREGIVAILSHAGHEVIAAVGNAPDLVAAVERTVTLDGQLDLVLTDVRMPPGGTNDGMRAAIELRSRHRDLPVIVLSAYVAGPYVTGLLESGEAGVGYLLKERIGNVDYFLSSIQVVAAGGVVVDPEVVAYQVERAPPRLRHLTPREREVLNLMAQGLSNREIGENLSVSTAAVAKHVANVFLKLGMTPGEENRRVQAVLTWLQA